MKSSPEVDSAQMRIVQLGHPMRPGMPHMPAHPPYEFTMAMSHDWTPEHASPTTGTADVFTAGTHVGTHMDSVYHVARENHLHGGIAIGDATVTQSEGNGLIIDGVDNFEPIVASAVLLDFAAFLGVAECPADLEIDADLLEACVARSTPDGLREGDVVLFRTGWDDLFYSDPARYLSFPMPGPTLGAAKLLRTSGVRAVGSDTAAFEKVPLPEQLAPHAELLIDGGIPIFESLQLAELALIAPGRFRFVCAPLRLTGATGCPVNPLAFVN